MAKARPTHDLSVRSVTLHGHRVTYREAGPPDGDPVVLLHGMVGSSRSWMPILPQLIEHHRVLAPDLLGHGQSAKPRGDYSPGAFASGIRDLMVALGWERATIVGHSLGGGVAMQFAYQFPHMSERLVLVGSGGLGRGVGSILKACSLPGAEIVLPLVMNRHLASLGGRLHRLVRKLPVPLPAAFDEVGRSYASLAETEARLAFVHTIRSCIDVFGQRINASDRLYLTSHLPTLIVWGTKDPIIPVRHGKRAHELATNSRLELFEGAGHWPHHDDPDRFLEMLLDFVERTEASHRGAFDFRSQIVEQTAAAG